MPGLSVDLALDHVGIVADDPAACAEVLCQALGAVRDDAAPDQLLLGDARLRLQPPAAAARAARALAYLALRTSALQPLCERLDAAGVAHHEARTPEGARMIRLDAKDWSGIPLTVAEVAGEAQPAAGDGNVVGIDHVGVASEDNMTAEERFCRVLGLSVESRQTDTETTVRVEQFTSDTYGVRVETRQAAHSGMRILFLSLANVDLELLADLSASADAGDDVSSSTAGDRTAIARYVERSGPGLHHLALRVGDIDAALARAEAGGARLLDRHGRPGSRRARIAFLDPRSTGRVLFHLVER